MMSFCKNTLRTFLGFSPTPTPTSTSPTRSSSSSTYRNSLSSSLPVTAGLITITDNSLPPKSPANILESSTLKLSSISTTTTTTKQQDSISCSGSGSSLDEITTGSGSIDGLSSCTESLGFESSEQMEQTIHESSPSSSSSRSFSKKMRMNANTTTVDCRKTKDGVNQMFPPLLSSLRNKPNGQNSTCFLKPVRQNGRLLLTQVNISRPQVFRASRQDGRLILQFIKQEETQESNEIDDEDVMVEKEELKESCSGGGVEWKIPAAGEGLKRCNLHHQNHHMQHWNQPQPQCVTSR